MKFPSPFLPSLLSLVLVSLLHSPLPSTAAPFVCTTPKTPTCQSLIGYIPINRTTYAALKSLFTIKSIRTLFSANDLLPSTRSSTSIPAGSVVRVPIPCSCLAGSGSSSGRPIYVVKAGDGLDSIARNNFGGFVTYQDIAKANNISNPNLIEVGERLLIPMPCSCDPVDGESVVHYAHFVAAGSTVASIAEDFGVSQDVLLRINGIKDPKDLLAGQVLDVPLRACSSSISNSTIDRNLRIPNHSYALTAKNCVLCNCSSTTWQLDCHPTQGISKNSCPVAKCGSLSLGNKSVSACETSICSYAGYTASNILTVLTNQCTCNGSGPTPGSSHGSALRVGVGWVAWTQLMILHIVLFLFGLMWNEIS
ncbi:chitin elicitor-binding protein-like isoform X2 [Dendrobium catenatum]|uniref:chitin elicitor-binding protein-like isoform X2 n=1 Tax=Dendrobium catenatum TaxID=906689 RepID=UPI0009F29095|nr:chitin elicitor-binding protein-like isoform X2 [Dendrobium catenatum]